MKKWTVVLIVIMVVVVLAIVLFIQFARHAIFSPSREMMWVPEEDYEDVFIRDVHGDQTINAWYFDRNHEDTIIFYHGSSGNISDRSYMVEISKIVNCNLLLVDYRGFGRSMGKPSQESVCGDGISTYDWLIRRGVDPSHVLVWGESLGGSVGTYVASRRKCKSLLVMSSFSSIDDIIRDRYPGHPLFGALSNLIASIFYTLPSKRMICDVKCPVVIMHSTDDTMIPYNNAVRMYEAAREPKLLITIKGDHSSPVMMPGEVRAMVSFCGMHLDMYEDEQIQDILSRVKVKCDGF